jgi:hypothetical protein
MPADLSPEATVSEPGTPPPSGPRPANGAGPGPSAAGFGPSAGGPSAGGSSAGGSSAGGPSAGGRSAAGRGWTAGRVIAVVVGSVLLVASGGLFGAGVVLTWAVVLDADAPELSWLAGELLAAAVMVGVLALALIVIPIRMASTRD